MRGGWRGCAFRPFAVFGRKRAVVFGDLRARLVEFVRGNGIIRLVDEHTLVDHIGLVLHLMARIADNRPEVLCE